MKPTTSLLDRAGNACELCSATEELNVYAVPPKSGDEDANVVVVCATCLNAIQNKNFTDTNHWRCLTGSIWSEHAPVQALSYQILNALQSENWAQEALESVFLDESIINWANAEAQMEADKVVHKDAFGVILENGDNVILTQNLNVKGANFIAPKGTSVRKIKLVPDNAEQIEGKIEGDVIVILTKYVKKQA